MLGGSRARGDHHSDSDYDLGLYYRPPLDVVGLRALAAELAGPHAEVTEPGGWGPWVDGGGWLGIDGQAVDWIYRDLDRVQRAWRDAEVGRFAFHRQPNHQLGVPDFAYAGEVALGVVLDDPSGELAALKAAAVRYPPALADALVRGLWEPAFELDAARKGAARGDTTWLAGVVFHALLLCAHALHGRAGRWLLNEKGAVAAAGALDIAPPDFARRCHEITGALGTSATGLHAALDAAQTLVTEVVQACR